MTLDLSKAIVHDIPADDSLHSSSRLVFPGRCLDRQGADYRVPRDTVFIPAGQQTWDSKFYDGLRVLLDRSPPPIHLPRSVTVARLDRLPGQDRQLEGKRWTLTWTDITAEVVVSGQNYPVRCSFTVYHKYDKGRGEANWRIYAVITPKMSQLPPGGVKTLEKLDSVELRLRYGRETTSKESALTLGPNPRKNNLSRPEGDKEEATTQRHQYVVLSPGEFEWISPERESFARAHMRMDPTCADLLEREHFRTHGQIYRFVPHSSATWFQAELRDVALIGIPRCSLLVPISSDGMRFMGEVSKQFGYTPGPKSGTSYQLCEWSLPAFADSVDDFERPEAYGKVNMQGGGC